MQKKSLKKYFENLLTLIHIVLVGLMFGIGILSFFRPEIIKSGIEWMRLQIQFWGQWNYLILFITAMAESFPFVGAVLPGMNIMILVGGFFIAKNWDIFPLAASLAMVWACLGNSFGYFMGKYGNPETLKKYGSFFWAGPRELKWLEKQITKNGFWFIVWGKFHNLLRSFIPYIAGSHQMSGKKFWLANIFWSSIWAFSILLLGIFAVESYEIILRYFNYLLLVLIVSFMVIYFIKQTKNKKGA